MTYSFAYLSIKFLFLLSGEHSYIDVVYLVYLILLQRQ